MRELDDQQRYFLLLEQRAKVLREEIAEERRRLGAYLARWSPKNNVVEFKSPRKSVKVSG
jgi:hypothetical protein